MMRARLFLRPVRLMPLLTACALLCAALPPLATAQTGQTGTQDRGSAVLPGTAPMAEVIYGTVLLTPRVAPQLAGSSRRLARIAFPDRPADSLPPVVADTDTDPAHRLLRRLFAAGQAAGNLGDLYDNRDRGHSRLSPRAHPQLTHIRYDPDFRDMGLDYGLSGTMLYDAPVIGNSSTALTRGALWRSHPRLAMTADDGALMQVLYENYRAGQIHVYPEHRDHDPIRGDLYPANTPYVLISQGSSGSDQPHLEALAMILAALRPDTKARAFETGLLAPLVQMIYRRSRAPVLSRADYLSGAAHPSVFDAAEIRLARMVTLANAIAPDEIPPVVRLNVLDESAAVEGVDFFGDGLSEVLFDTPSAIGRVWRSRDGQRRMLVSAEATADPNGRDLTFDWVLLRGDPGQVEITPLTPDGRNVRITLGWQGARPAPGTSPEPGAPGLRSARVDIGVFANNGIHDSAPAFLSVQLPAHETRIYAEEDPMRPISIDRKSPGTGYADPLLFPATDWRDVYLYDEDGTPKGWIRHRGEVQSLFDAEGRRLSAQDGHPVALHYPIDSGPGGWTRVDEEPLDPED